jgi:hypothetical protein
MAIKAAIKAKPEELAKMPAKDTSARITKVYKMRVSPSLIYTYTNPNKWEPLIRLSNRRIQYRFPRKISSRATKGQASWLKGVAARESGPTSSQKA